MNALRGLCLALAAVAAASPASAEDLYRRSPWAALTSDRVAARAGDVLTVVVFESANVSKSNALGAKRSTEVGGGLSSSGGGGGRGALDLTGEHRGGAQLERSERLVAQISVSVEYVLANGDLYVSGEQNLDLGGERTRIRLRGRVRPEDVRADNTVLSSRLAGAVIDYGGQGFVSGGAKPGVVARAFRFLGLL